MGDLYGYQLKEEHPLMKQMHQLERGEVSPLSETLTEEEVQTQSFRRLFMTKEEMLREEKIEWVQSVVAHKKKWEQEQYRYQQTQLTHNKNDKALSKLKTPEEIAALREKRHLKAIEADKMRVFCDKMRHGFYKFVGKFVEAGRWFTEEAAEERETATNPEYEMPGLYAEYHRLKDMQPLPGEPDFEKKKAEYQAKYGSYFNHLKTQYEEKEITAEKIAEEKLKDKELSEEERVAEKEKLKREYLEAETYRIQFGDSVQAHVEGGTKPNALQYGEDGSKWLMKTNHSCIGMAAPNASIMTVAGYKVQKLVNPDTAIEAFESKSRGVGTVSLQRMVEGVVPKTIVEGGREVPNPDYIDFFRFSRTPESMTPAELKKIEKVAPDLLREYMTDFLLGNYDTKGENFLLCRDPQKGLVVRGIDKEASGRKDLVPEAQHMTKDIHFFDQDTVYNQLFRQFADGTMDFDLLEAGKYIDRIEQMSTEEYLEIYKPYFERQKLDRTPEEFEQIKKNVIYRKEFIRIEARRFFGELVKERMQSADEEEAKALQEKYLGGTKNGVFLFGNETAEDLQKERERVVLQKEADAAALEEKVRKADEADAKSYKIRHAVYDMAKTVIMGLKSLKLPEDNFQEERTTKVRMIELETIDSDDWDDSLADVKKVFEKHYAAIQKELKVEEAKIDKEMRASLKKEALKRTEAELGEEVDLKMVGDREIFLGGTKPMSQYIAADKSLWLAKQAVTCVGTTKLSGAYLTQIGSMIQKLVDAKTAVQAFVGKTAKHGMVSFQRMLKNVVSSKQLDLFRFSKHPELATQDTVHKVEKLMPQILREHVTDWLLCNFDTKGENFVLTQEAGKEMVLHGIDKEASFNKILEAKAQQMSIDYKPHTNNTLYNVVFTKFANGEMDFDLKEIIPYVEKIVNGQTDEEYLENYQVYIDYLTQKAGDDQKELDKVAQIKTNILLRKSNLKEEYTRFFTELIESRCTHLHPDEAKALRLYYYGEGGTKFQF